MLTMEKLASFGADTATGLARCMNNEAFYLRLVNMELGDVNYEAFYLRLVPIYQPVTELTELLRNADGQADPGNLPERIMESFAALKALAE